MHWIYIRLEYALKHSIPAHRLHGSGPNRLDNMHIKPGLEPSMLVGLSSG